MRLLQWLVLGVVSLLLAGCGTPYATVANSQHEQGMLLGQC